MSTGDPAGARQTESGAIPRDIDDVVEEPSVADVACSTCHYCGTAYAGEGDDCGARPLTGEDLVRYGRDRAAVLVGDDGSRS